MVVGDVVDIQEVAQKRHVVNLVFASSMVGERGVRSKAAPGVLKDRLACASLTVVDDVVSSSAVLKVRRGVPHSVKRTVVERDAYLLAAQKVPKEAHRSAKGTVVGNVACLMVVGYAQKVCMEVQISVLPMEEERGVPFPVAPRVPVARLIVVSNMVGENGARSKIAGRVLRVVLTSARPTEVERGATGVRGNAKNLQEERMVSALHTAAWFRAGRRNEQECLGQASSTD